MTAYRSFAEQALHYFIRDHAIIPEGAVSSPADWLGEDMQGCSDQWLELLSEQELDEIEAATDALMSRSVPMSEVARESFALPTLSARLMDWRAEISAGRGFVVVRGLPVEDWGREKSAFAYWGLGHHLGLPGGQNPQGELLGHVVDYSEEEDNPVVRRYRTTGNIDFHCDAADCVGLLCLHTAMSGGQSRIASSVAIFNEVSRREPGLIPRLFEPFALDRRDEQGEGEPTFLPIQPCCYEGEGMLRTFYHSEYFRSAERLDDVTIDDAQRRILDVYDELCASPEYYLDMWLEPGDMQFISNHTTLHSRTEYEDWPEPDRKRHLLRLWLSF